MRLRETLPSHFYSGLVAGKVREERSGFLSFNSPRAAGTRRRYGGCSEPGELSQALFSPKTSFSQIWRYCNDFFPPSFCSVLRLFSFGGFQNGSLLHSFSEVPVRNATLGRGRSLLAPN